MGEKIQHDTGSPSQNVARAVRYLFRHFSKEARDAIAERAGLNPSTFADYASGTKTMSEEKRDKLARTLGLELHDLAKFGREFESSREADTRPLDMDNLLKFFVEATKEEGPKEFEERVDCTFREIQARIDRMESAIGGSGEQYGIRRQEEPGV